MRNSKISSATFLIPLFIFCSGCENKSEIKTSNDSIPDTAKAANQQNDSLHSKRQDSPATVVKPLPWTETEKHDTLFNYIDASGKRQGYWEITGAMKKDLEYAPKAIVESGSYKDDLKEGQWKVYNPDGSFKRRVNYRKGKEIK